MPAGKVYKVAEDRSSSPKMEVYASFGGLLMLLKVRTRARAEIARQSLANSVDGQGEPGTLKDLVIDMRIYLLIKTIA